MRVTLARDNLAPALQRATAIAPKKGPLPVLSHVLLDATGADDRITITATDSELAYVGTVPAKVEARGAWCVPAAELSAAVRSLGESMVTLTIERNRFAIKAGAAKIRLNMLEGAAFPGLAPMDPAAQPIRMAQAVLRRILEQSGYAAAVEDVRYGLNGLHIESSGQLLRLVATDGHRLAAAHGPASGELAVPPAVLIPRKASAALLKLLDGPDESTVDLRIGDGAMLASVPDVSLWFRLIDGAFPDWRQVVPPTWDSGTIVTCVRDDLIAACKRLALVTTDDRFAATFSVSANAIGIVLDTADGAVEDQIAAQAVGGDLVFAMDPDLLSETLARTLSETVRISITAPLSPIRIEGVGTDHGLSIVMPMHPPVAGGLT